MCDHDKGVPRTAYVWLVAAAMWLLTAHPSILRAQNILPRVEPGAIVTLPVRTVPVAAAAGAGPAHFRIRSAGDAVVIGDSTGTAAWLPREGILPVTLRLARGAAAGEHTLASVIVDWPDGTRTTHPVRAVVEVRRALALDVSAAPRPPAAGRHAVIIKLENRGNARDTVRLDLAAPMGWSLEGAPDPLVLDPTQGIVETVHVRADGPLIPDQIVELTVRATGAAKAMPLEGDAADSLHAAEPRTGTVATTHTRNVAAASLRLRAGKETGRDDHIRLPTTLFVGTASPDGARSTVDRTSLAVHASGTLSPETTVELDVRRPSSLSAPVAFLDRVYGPRLRLRVARPNASVTVGDVRAHHNTLRTTYLRGAGARADWTRGDLEASAFVARPGSHAFDLADEGRAMQARAGLRRPLGTFSISALSTTEPSHSEPGNNGIRAAAVRYETSSTSPHRLNVEGGLVRLEPVDGPAVLGPAFEAAYAYSDRHATLTARARHVPGVLPELSAAANELFVHGSHHLLGPVDALGTVFSYSTPDVSSDVDPLDRGATGGLRYAAAGRQLRLLGSYRKSNPLLSNSGVEVRRSIITSGAMPLGRSLRLTGRAEIGRRDLSGRTGLLQRYRATLRWQARETHVSVAATYRRGDLPDHGLRIDANGGIDHDAYAIRGGVGATLGAPSKMRDDISAWTGATLSVLPDLALVGGVEYRPWRIGSSGWQVALGVERKLSVPLPVDRSPTLSGRVFRDVDGDGQPDAGEAGLADVLVSLGDVRVLTDSGGGFEFPAGTGGGARLQIDPRTLGADLSIAPGTMLPRSGHVEVPVVRLASLRLNLFLDHDLDGNRDSDERPARSVRVILVDRAGRERLARTDDRGDLTLAGIQHGTYRLRVRPPTRPGRDPTVINVAEITIDQGASVERQVAVPFERREIRFGPSL